jgi:D-glycero-D-manno-heptose 1,7-bisphosphate phosphatase
VGVLAVSAATTGKPAVFLDRDGVLIRTFVRDGVPHPPNTVDELEVLPGVAEALGRLRDAGFALIVVTNQPDVARGTQRREVIEAMNAQLARDLALDGVYTCYHDNADNCACRKPKAGLIHQAAAEHGLDVAASYLVGDRWSDCAAGAAAGCRTVLIDQPYSQEDRCAPDAVATDLGAAVDYILRQPSATRTKVRPHARA